MKWATFKNTTALISAFLKKEFVIYVFIHYSLFIIYSINSFLLL